MRVSLPFHRIEQRVNMSIGVVKKEAAQYLLQDRPVGVTRHQNPVGFTTEGRRNPYRRPTGDDRDWGSPEKVDTVSLLPWWHAACVHSR
ncbi:hypothetical protein GCM10027213_57970 [Mycobacterium bourgelatii]